MTNPYRALCAELAEEVEHLWSIVRDDNNEPHSLANRARALLDQPAAEGPKPVVDYSRVPEIATDAQIRSAAQYLVKKRNCDGDLIPAIEYAIARWGHPTPQPPAAGEVEVALIELRSTVMGLGQMGMFVAAQRVRRAADLLERQHLQPVAVSERLPDPSVKVLAHYFNALGKGRTICAIWVPAKSRSDEGDLDADDFLEYDEDGDKYYWPEGWYEAIENWEELGWAKVYEGEIAYWQPLPQWPALPTPEDTP